MSEKRKPVAKIVAVIRGKKTLLELFHASEWPDKFPISKHGQFRVRMNGKWRPETWTITQVLRGMRGWMSKKIFRPYRTN